MQPNRPRTGLAVIFDCLMAHMGYGEDDKACECSDCKPFPIYEDDSEAMPGGDLRPGLPAHPTTLGAFIRGCGRRGPRRSAYSSSPRRVRGMAAR